MPSINLLTTRSIIYLMISSGIGACTSDPAVTGQSPSNQNVRSLRPIETVGYQSERDLDIKSIRIDGANIRYKIYYRNGLSRDIVGRCAEGLRAEPMSTADQINPKFTTVYAGTNHGNELGVACSLARLPFIVQSLPAAPQPNYAAIFSQPTKIPLVSNPLTRTEEEGQSEHIGVVSADRNSITANTNSFVVPILKAIAKDLKSDKSGELLAQAQPLSELDSAAGAKPIYVWRSEPVAVDSKVPELVISGRLGPAPENIYVKYFGQSTYQFFSSGQSSSISIQSGPYPDPLIRQPAAEGFEWIGVIPASPLDVTKLSSGTVEMNGFVLGVTDRRVSTGNLKDVPISGPLEIKPLSGTSSPTWVIATDGSKAILLEYAVIPVKAGYFLLSGVIKQPFPDQNAMMLREIKPTPVRLSGSIHLPAEWIRVGLYRVRNGSLGFDETGVWLGAGTEYKSAK